MFAKRKKQIEGVAVRRRARAQVARAKQQALDAWRWVRVLGMLAGGLVIILVVFVAVQL